MGDNRRGYLFFLLLFLWIGSTTAPILAQPLWEKSFEIQAEAEVLLTVTAASPRASWVVEGREAAAIRLYVDGRYHQDLLLHGGEADFAYQLLLGRQQPGQHTLRLEHHLPLSARGTERPTVRDVQFELRTRNDPDFLPLAYAPILYARPDTIGRFSDLPLLIYYETEAGEQGGTIYRYTAIFSNEDGGTQTSGLMARWGRTTDIEWVNEVHLDRQGRLIRHLYQGVNHETKPVIGEREGDHPLFLVASVNNNFDDQRKSDVRFALRPIPVDLTRSSRETVMDAHPWIYRIMAEEMIREAKITPERTLGQSIRDLRDYLYLDGQSAQQNGSAISFAVKLTGDPRWFVSDLGIPSYKIERSGHFRTTMLLPPGTRPEQVERLAIRCDLPTNPRGASDIVRATTARCEVGAIQRLFFLDASFQPGAEVAVRFSPLQLAFGEVIEIPVGVR
jgi:hypothetical protein